MRMHLGTVREIVPSIWQHLPDWYDRGYLDHRWGYDRRNCSGLTAAQLSAYNAGWRAADADGTANCYARPPVVFEETTTRHA